MVQKFHSPRGLPLDQILLGDNLELISKLPDRCIDLVYSDGPYYTDKDWGDFMDKFKSMSAFIRFMGERLEQCALHHAGELCGQLRHHAGAAGAAGFVALKAGRVTLVARLGPRRSSGGVAATVGALAAGKSLPAG